MLLNKKVVLLGFAFGFLTLTHIPVGIFPHIFDKNLAPQFISLTAIATAMGLYILFKPADFKVDRKVQIAIYTLIVVVAISALTSGNIVSSLTGDTGRFTGAISLFCLLIIAIFHSRLTFASFGKLLPFYLAFIFIQALIGIAQRWLGLELPGVDGVTGTFGNQDFYTAFIGVSAPLFFLAGIRRSARVKLIIAAAYATCIYAIYLSGPLQGWVDLAFALTGFIAYRYRRFIPRRDFKVNSRTFVGTLAVVIWAEFIFLVPFLGSWIPVLGNDIQVKIRANFWLAGTQGFFSHPIFGLGPDQYGNYYEEFRTTSDTQNYSRILSNDAHSASVQTLATLGIAGTLAILILLAFLIRSIIILWDSKPKLHRELFILGLFFFIYLTNSFISPITFPAKYLLWAVAGLVVGAVYRSRPSQELVAARSLRLPVLLLLIPTIIVGSNFALAQYRYNVAFEKFVDNRSAQIDYRFSQFIPCFMYFEGQFQMVQNQGNEAIAKLAQAQVDANPRCVSARVVLAQIFELQGDAERLKNEIYSLVTIAPSREEVLNIGMRYANRNQDTYLLEILQRELSERGLVYVPGTEG